MSERTRGGNNVTKTADGRWRARVQVPGQRTATGQPTYVTRVARTKSAALAWQRQTTAELATGSYLRPTTTSVSAWADKWINSMGDRKPATVRNYSDAIKPFTAKFGRRELRTLARADLLAWRAELMRTETRGKLPSPRTINWRFGVIAHLLNDAVREGLIPRSPAEHVDRVRDDRPRAAKVWSHDQVLAFLAGAADHAFGVGYQFSLRGLRRGEACALRWDDLDLDKGTVSITRNASVVHARVVEGSPKSRRSVRTLALDAPLIKVLREAKREQAKDRLRHGSSYLADEHGGYVLCNEIGEPIRPEFYSDEFQRLSKKLKLPRVRLHDLRHTSVSFMIDSGVSPTVVAAWHGHSLAVCLDTYAQARPDTMQAAASLLGQAFALPREAGTSS